MQPGVSLAGHGARRAGVLPTAASSGRRGGTAGESGGVKPGAVGGCAPKICGGAFPRGEAKGVVALSASDSVTAVSVSELWPSRVAPPGPSGEPGPAASG